MGGVIYSLGWLWNYFRQQFDIDSFTSEGSITLGPGEQTLEIETRFPNPDQVYLCVEETDDAVATCVGDLNWVAARITDNGFILFANITSNSCTVTYSVRYLTNNNIPVQN